MERLLNGRVMTREKLGGRSLRSVYNDVARGIFPPPVKISRSTFWREADIDLFISLGCNMQRLLAERPSITAGV